MKSLSLIYTTLPLQAKRLFLLTTIIITLASLTEVTVIFLINNLSVFSKNNLFGPYILEPHQYTFLVLATIAFACALKIFSNIFIHHTLQWLKYYYNKTILNSFLIQRFSRAISEDRDTIQKEILSEVEFIVDQIHLPVLRFLSALVLSILIGSYLIYLDYRLALFLLGSICGLYIILFVISKKIIARLGAIRTIANEKRVLTLDNILNNYLELRLYEKEFYYAERFEHAAYSIAKARRSEVVISESPRIFIEYFMLGLIAYWTIQFFLAPETAFDKDISDTPYIAFLYAGFKLVPAIQHIYFAYVRINFSGEVLEKFRKYQNFNFIPTKFENLHKNETFKSLNIAFDDTEICVTLRNVADKFQNAYIIRNLEIENGDWIYVTGPSGVGKSKLFENYVATCVRSQNFSDKNNVVMVNQSTSLLNATVIENITLSHDPYSVSDQTKEKVFLLADILSFNFIKNEKDFFKNVSTLSGGEKQRVLIARALFSDKPIVIFDESFSGLNKDLRSKIFSKIKEIYPKKVIIVISHDLFEPALFNKKLIINKSEKVN